MRVVNYILKRGGHDAVGVAFAVAGHSGGESPEVAVSRVVTTPITSACNTAPDIAALLSTALYLVNGHLGSQIIGLKP